MIIKHEIAIEEHMIRIENENPENPNFLFVCDANCVRSPAFEKWFIENRPQYNVRSCGIQDGYPHALSNNENAVLLLEWATKVFVMDLRQEMYISDKYPEFKSKVEMIGVNDTYSDHNAICRFWTDKMGL
jgi:predicted protein tyrosine phosphatase